MASKRGRKAPVDLVFFTLGEAVSADCPKLYQPYQVTILGQTRFTMASSSSNAVRLTAYSLGATAKVVSIRDALDLHFA